MNKPRDYDWLIELVCADRLTHVVDVGANPIDGDPPYRPLLDAGLCRLTGFEPQAEALARLNADKSANETYLPWAVGDGNAHTLHECRASGMTSLLPPDPRALAAFNDFEMLGEVVSSRRVETRRLDDIADIQNLDFLKIDIQGTELAVFEGGREKLARCAVVQTELSFVPLYSGQPVYWEIDRELRSQGFMPHAFAAIKRWPLAPWVQDHDSRRPLNQLLEADLIYVRDILHPDSVDTEALRQTSIIAHVCFGSHDLVLRCIRLLAERGAVAADAPDRYLDQVGNGRPSPAQVPGGEIISFDMDFDLR